MASSMTHISRSFSHTENNAHGDLRNDIYVSYTSFPTSLTLADTCFDTLTQQKIQIDDDVEARHLPRTGRSALRLDSISFRLQRSLYNTHAHLRLTCTASIHCSTTQDALSKGKRDGWGGKRRLRTRCMQRPMRKRELNFNSQCELCYLKGASCTSTGGTV